MTRLIRRFTLFSASGFILSVAIHILGLLNKASFFIWFAIPPTLAYSSRSSQYLSHFSGFANQKEKAFGSERYELLQFG